MKRTEALNIKITKNTKDKLKMIKMKTDLSFTTIVEKAVNSYFEKFLIENELNKTDFDLLIDPTIKNWFKGVSND